MTSHRTQTYVHTHIHIAYMQHPIYSCVSFQGKAWKETGHAMPQILKSNVWTTCCINMKYPHKSCINRIINNFCLLIVLAPRLHLIIQVSILLKEEGRQQNKLWNSVIYMKLSSCCTKIDKACMAKEMYT